MAAESLCDGIPNSSTAGMPRSATSRTSPMRLPMESWVTPGMELMGLRMFSPAMTKNG